MKRKSLLLSLLLLSLLFAATASAQQRTPAPAGEQPPAFITIDPQAGIPLDPFFLSLKAGGTVDASTLDKSCVGSITKNPSVAVDVKGQPDVVKAFFYSDGDPVLVVQLPDGTYRCNDNTNRLLLDPTVQVDDPQPGHYNIWAGSRKAKQPVPGILVLTTQPGVNVGNFRLADLVKRPAIPETLPDFPVLNPELRDRLVNAAKAAAARAPTLSAGGPAVTQPVGADGSLPVAGFLQGRADCNGFVRVAPSYLFNWQGNSQNLRIFYEGNHDTSLIVRGPGAGGTFYCDDDVQQGNNNPLVDIPNPAPGTYAVWVGRVSTRNPVTGTLTITESPKLAPKLEIAR